MVRTSRCGRDNPGSTPGAVIIDIHTSGQCIHYSLDNGRLKTSNDKPINRFPENTSRRTVSRIFEIRGSIVVSISACHADDPGSIPGRGDSCAFNAWATCLLSSQCTFMEALQMPPRRQSPSPVARGHALGYELAVRGKVLGVGCRCAGVGRYGFSGRHKIPTLLGHTKDRIV